MILMVRLLPLLAYKQTATHLISRISSMNEPRPIWCRRRSVCPSAGPTSLAPAIGNVPQFHLGPRLTMIWFIIEFYAQIRKSYESSSTSQTRGRLQRESTR